MPLGDSITEITCWRTLLWDDLQADGVTSSFEFVGSMTNNAQNCQGNSGWDMHHEGHSGYLAINIANTNLQGWLASVKPDVVMFMLGTNDVAQGKSTTDIMASYTKMVQLMRASNANMKIIVSPTPNPLSAITNTTQGRQSHPPRHRLLRRHRRHQQRHPRLGLRPQHHRLPHRRRRHRHRLYNR